MNDVTRIPSAIEQGEPHAAEQLLPLVYEELRKLAATRLAGRSRRDCNAAGTAALGPAAVGIEIVAGGNTIAGNVIVTNNVGIRSCIARDPQTGMVIQGNLIGTDATGTAALGNHIGIILGNGTGTNTIATSSRWCNLSVFAVDTSPTPSGKVCPRVKCNSL